LYRYSEGALFSAWDAVPAVNDGGAGLTAAAAAEEAAQAAEAVAELGGGGRGGGAKAGGRGEGVRVGADAVPVLPAPPVVLPEFVLDAPAMDGRVGAFHLHQNTN
jgi:hypothetical protein